MKMKFLAIAAVSFLSFVAQAQVQAGFIVIRNGQQVLVPRSELTIDEQRQLREMDMMERQTRAAEAQADAARQQAEFYRRQRAKENAEAAGTAAAIGVIGTAIVIDEVSKGEH